MAVMDILISATDNASGVIESVGERGAKAGNWLEENWAKVGAGTAIAGAGIESLARTQAPLTEQTDKLARNLGTTSEEMRDLAKDTSNVTFPMEDVLDLMQIGSERGLESAEALKKYAENWDLVGDATGLSGTELGKAGTALEALGITAGEEEKAFDAFGYITEETTSDVSDFLAMVERLGPELGDMGLNVDQTAGLMGALEGEMGLSGRTARQELRTAMNEADGSIEKMLETLGLSEAQFEEYTNKVGESSGVLEENAEIHGESYTAMEKAQHWASELSYKYGDLFGMLSNLTPVLLALGPIIKGVSVAKGIMATVMSGSLIPAITGAISSTWAFTTALLANPITWVVVAIMALIAVIVLLWKNWDEVSAFLSDSWEWLKEKAGDFFTGVIEWFSKLPGRIGEFFSMVVEKTLTFFGGMITTGIEKGSEFLESVVGFFASLPGRLWEKFTSSLEKLMTFGSELISKGKQYASEAIEGIISFYTQLPGRIWGKFMEVITKVISFGGDLKLKMTNLASDAVDKFIGKAKDLPGLLWDVLKDTAKKILNIGGQIWDNAKSLGSKLWSGFKKGIGKNSPSYLEKAMDDISNKSHDMKDEMDADFDYINNFRPADYSFEPVAEFGSGSNRPIDHRHDGVIRVEIDGPGDRVQEYKDIIIDEIRREVRA